MHIINYIFIWSSESEDSDTSIEQSYQFSVDPSNSKEINDLETEQQQGEEESDVEKDLFEKENSPVTEDKEEDIYFNNNVNSDSDGSFDESDSSSESFYSFESETENSERRVAFGSVKSLVQEEKYNHTIEGKFSTILLISILVLFF